MPKKYNHIEGDKVGDCYFICYDGIIGKRNWEAAKFICGHCSKEFRESVNKVRNRLIKSCGCMISSHLQNRHGMKRTPEHTSWQGAKARCNYKGKNSYHLYGEKGKKMCHGWQSSFKAFFDQLGNKPSKEHSLDRIENKGHYSCGKCDECIANGWTMNCRWGLPEIQQNNKSNNVFITFNSKTLTVSQWSREVGINKNTINSRIKRGWKEDRLFINTRQ